MYHVKDGSPNCPSPNLSPDANGPLVDATVRAITAKIQPALDELIRQIMLHGGIPGSKSLNAYERKRDWFEYARKYIAASDAAREQHIEEIRAKFAQPIRRDFARC